MKPGSGIWATVDRIVAGEDGKELAVLVFDDGQQLVVPESALPPETLPGELLEVSLIPSPSETASRADEIQRLQQELFGQ